MASVYADGIEYIRVKVGLSDDSGAVIDPTHDTVMWAFLDDDDVEATTTWVYGAWQTVGDKYYARCLIGADVTLTAGRYSVLVKVITSSETIIRRAGTLTVK